MTTKPTAVQNLTNTINTYRKNAVCEITKNMVNIAGVYITATKQEAKQL